ncbi:uncharacterized protein DUF4190 [Stackebrandtia albiflava]|uniref:Uncharacterized protein DUF4190 n=1 Tax=Stackebrandtia albiflava TaxID=406432 RepID=A0A562VAG1_9ACTN|nr:DUF4190 domain-containing protein [Stackebrandtia albiflava]TWJ14838.1 uncharacterized protein DUF4190 [Stackebrandtia albiflava]
MTYDPYGNQPPHDPYGSSPPPQTPHSGAPGYYQDPKGQYDPYQGQYTAPPYMQQPMGYQAPQNGLGIAAMVLGIVSIPALCLCYAGVPTAILAIIFGAVGVSKASRGEATNKGMALAGIILGCATFLVLILWVVLVLVFGYADFNYYNEF